MLAPPSVLTANLVEEEEEEEGGGEMQRRWGLIGSSSSSSGAAGSIPIFPPHLPAICEQSGLGWIRTTDLDLIIPIGGITGVERQVRLPSLWLPPTSTPPRPCDPCPTSLTGQQQEERRI